MPTEGQTVAAPSSNGSNDDLTHNVAAPAELDRAAVTIVTLYFQCHDHAKSISISTKCSKFCYQCIFGRRTPLAVVYSFIIIVYINILLFYILTLLLYILIYYYCIY